MNFRVLLVASFLGFISGLSAKTAVVTGGAGFLGSHLCDRLLAENYRVLCVDNLYTGSLSNIAHLRTKPGFVFIEQDVTVAFDPCETLDEIYNLACPASPNHYQAQPVKTLLTSVLGAYNLLELARRYNAKIFQASTSEIYGDPLEHPQEEKYWGHVNSIGIRACYDEGKRAAESLFFDFHRLYNTQIKVARIFNTYGPRLAAGDGRVVSNFIVQALQDKPITIYGTGLQTRSFCYVNDLIDGIRRLMNTPADFTGPVNLGNPQETTMLSLAEAIIALTQSKSELMFLPLPQDDPKKRLPNISLAKKVMDWHPQTSLEEGLRHTIQYFQEPFPL